MRPDSEAKINTMAAIAKESLRRFHDSIDLSILNTVASLLSWITISISETHPLHVMAMIQLADALFMRFHLAHHKRDILNAVKFLRHSRTHPAAQSTFYIRHHIFFRTFVTAMTHANLSGDIYEFRDVLVYVAGVQRELKAPSIPLSDPNSFITDTEYDHTIHSGDRELLNAEILHRRDTLAKGIVSTTFYRKSVSNLGYLLSFRFREQNRRSDLDEAVFWAQLALDLTSQSDYERPAQLKSLARVLSDRFCEDNQSDDLRTAVGLMRECFSITPPTHVLRWEYILELGQILFEQFEQDGNVNGLEEVIQLQNQARKLMPEDAAGQHILLNSLGFAFVRRFECMSGQQRDLDEATVMLRTALALTPPSHRGRLQSLCNLAGALFLRFRLTGQKGYLEEAIIFRQDALKLVVHPGNSSHFSLILNLSISLSARYNIDGQQSDIDEAVLLAKKACDMTPPFHTRRPSVLMTLATRLMTRAEEMRSPLSRRKNDINDSIEYGRQALKLTSSQTTSLYRPLILINLSSALCMKWEIESNRESLDESIMLVKKAMSLFPEDRPQHALCLHQLGKTLTRAYSYLNEQHYLDEAITMFRQCLKSPSISASLRFEIADEWATIADQHCHASAIEAYDAAVQVVPQVVSYNLDIHSRQEVLTNGPIKGFAQRAAKCALTRELHGKAIEYLEAGRVVFWGQFQRLRSPLGKLRKADPVIAEKVHTLFDKLERGSRRSKAINSFEVGQNLAFDKESSLLSKLNEELSATLVKIRKITGLENFLRPLPLEELQVAAADGSIVFLIPNNNESHCLIMTSKSVFHMTIPKFDTDTLGTFVSSLKLAKSQSWVKRSSMELNEFEMMEDAVLLHAEGASDRLGAKRVGPLSDISSDTIFRRILTCLWGYVVEPVLKRLSINVSVF